MVESKEELQKILNDFWLLDKTDYENLKSMISQKIYEIDVISGKRPRDEEDKDAHDKLILLREKITYIISNDLYKKINRKRYESR